jgi:hypothetical protein
MKYYKGRYKPRNPSKYRGDVMNITYRSHWEFQLFRWLDTQSFVVGWSSEEVIIPYRCKTDGQMHRYFVDVKLTFSDGRTLLVEVKPAKETAPPKKPARKTAKYITEVMTYAKNMSKWESALEYAADRGWVFEIWTEDVLRKLGIKIL